MVLPTDLFQGAPPLGPDNGTPNNIVDQMLRQAQQYKLVAGQNQLKAIRRNTVHYLNIDQTFEPGDLVFAFSESRGDQVPHQKLRIKWSGPYVFICRINSQMADRHPPLREGALQGQELCHPHHRRQSPTLPTQNPSWRHHGLAKLTPERTITRPISH